MKKCSFLTKLYQKDGTKTVLASLFAILIGLVLGSVLVFVVFKIVTILIASLKWQTRVVSRFIVNAKISKNR